MALDRKSSKEEKANNQLALSKNDVIAQLADEGLPYENRVVLTDRLHKFLTFERFLSELHTALKSNHAKMIENKFDKLVAFISRNREFISTKHSEINVSALELVTLYQNKSMIDQLLALGANYSNGSAMLLAGMKPLLPLTPKRAQSDEKRAALPLPPAPSRGVSAPHVDEAPKIDVNEIVFAEYLKSKGLTPLPPLKGCEPGNNPFGFWNVPTLAEFKASQEKAAMFDKTHGKKR